MVMQNRSRNPTDVTAGGVDILEDAVFAKGLWFEVGVAPGNCADRGGSGALLRVRNRCRSMLPGQVAVRWSRFGGRATLAASELDPSIRDTASLAPKQKPPAHRDDSVRRGLLLCTVRPGPPAGNLPGAEDRATSDRPVMGSPYASSRPPGACEPWACSSKGGERRRRASVGW